MLDPEIEKVLQEQARQHGENPQDLAEVSARLSAAAHAWEAEPTPNWPRLPMAAAAPRPTWQTLLGQWLPALMCLLMLGLLVGQGRFINDQDGFRLEFGAPAEVKAEPVAATDPDSITLTRTQLEQLLDQRLAEQNKRLTAAFRSGIADYHQSQQKYLTSVLEFQQNQISTDRARDLQDLVADWDRQRLKDLDQIENRLAYLVDQQSVNNDTLYDLANAVQRAPSED